MKLARVYPHHRFLILTHTKQECNELREKLQVLYKENTNIDIYTLNAFVLKLAKKYNLVLDYNMLKKDYYKTFNNIVKQARNIIKNKNMFKGIFIDEAESFKVEEIDEDTFTKQAGSYESIFVSGSQRGKDRAVYAFVDETEDEFEIYLDEFAEEE